jgi:hypothetical protein
VLELRYFHRIGAIYCSESLNRKHTHTFIGEYRTLSTLFQQAPKIHMLEGVRRFHQEILLHENEDVWPHTAFRLHIADEERLHYACKFSNAGAIETACCRYHSKVSLSLNFGGKSAKDSIT